MPESFINPSKRKHTVGGQELVEVELMLFSTNQRGTAVRVWDGNTYERNEFGKPNAKHVWLPTSQIHDWGRFSYTTGEILTIEIPEWLAFEKELI